MGNTESSAATVNNVPSSLDKIPLPPSSEVLDDSTESGSDVAQQSLREGEVQVANAVQGRISRCRSYTSENAHDNRHLT